VNTVVSIESVIVSQTFCPFKYSAIIYFGYQHWNCDILYFIFLLIA